MEALSTNCRAPLVEEEQTIQVLSFNRGTLKHNIGGVELALLYSWGMGERGRGLVRLWFFKNLWENHFHVFYQILRFHYSHPGGNFGDDGLAGGLRNFFNGWVRVGGTRSAHGTILHKNQKIVKLLK